MGFRPSDDLPKASVIRNVLTAWATSVFTSGTWYPLCVLFGKRTGDRSGLVTLAEDISAAFDPPATGPTWVRDEGRSQLTKARHLTRSARVEEADQTSLPKPNQMVGKAGCRKDEADT